MDMRETKQSTDGQERQNCRKQTNHKNVYPFETHYTLQMFSETVFSYYQRKHVNEAEMSCSYLRVL